MATNRSPSGGTIWPKPNCPKPGRSASGPAPQHTGSPLARSAQVWKSPLLTAMNRSTGVGVVVSAVGAKASAGGVELGAAAVGSGAGGGVEASAWAANRAPRPSIIASDAAASPTVHSRRRPDPESIAALARARPPGAALLLQRLRKQRSKRSLKPPSARASGGPGGGGKGAWRPVASIGSTFEAQNWPCLRAMERQHVRNQLRGLLRPRCRLAGGNDRLRPTLRRSSWLGP